MMLKASVLPIIKMSITSISIVSTGMVALVKAMIADVVFAQY